jgi:3-hydroxyanthranilate 3,4-dioxygenase
MSQISIVSLADQYRQLTEMGKSMCVQWQEAESIAFVARGREHRNEFHINPADEVIYLIRGEAHMHYRTPNGVEEVAVIPEGSVIRIPAGTPHSPRRAPDSFTFVLERKRREGEIDRFHWYCENCGGFLHEETFVVQDYRDDPVSKAYRRFFDNEDFRTCKQCGEIMAAHNL